MRRSTAITLLVLGTGTVVTAVALTDRCQPGQTGACSSAYGGSHYVGFVSGGGTSTSSPGTARAEDGDGGKKSISTNKSGAGTSVSSSATAHGGFGTSGAHASSSGS